MADWRSHARWNLRRYNWFLNQPPVTATHPHLLPPHHPGPGVSLPTAHVAEQISITVRLPPSETAALRAATVVPLWATVEVVVKTFLAHVVRRPISALMASAAPMARRV
ncbi:uncharacterized protein CLUP02_17834 [Colletotrichum lupini]|uniref:Uncharacterized protein n=1 Tax=Colletotrichum lupini TaxID=145971 RepID=A0A9Q8SFA5_9PEZI|nr:uncharacterized protein CLUP02_17834 [Colletotrichum lupini]UQC76321.1 hypothetical protein CLUP02_17834 [Colletotrichum lupini]